VFCCLCHHHHHHRHAIYVIAERYLLWDAMSCSLLQYIVALPLAKIQYIRTNWTFLQAAFLLQLMSLCHLCITLCKCLCYSRMICSLSRGLHVIFFSYIRGLFFCYNKHIYFIINKNKVFVKVMFQSLSTFMQYGVIHVRSCLQSFRS